MCPKICHLIKTCLIFSISTSSAQAVGGVPMMHVDSATALGEVGFEMDLRGCDHFNASGALRFVGRVDAAVDNTCDRVCASITGGARSDISSRT